MENGIKKCSSEDEKEANYYCIQCGINMCNKCENFHSKLFKNHKIYSLDKNIDEIFTGFCKEKNHNNNILHYFCKTHNQLCCAECISKIKIDNIGIHHDCQIDLIENIKEEKFKILVNNIKYLEDLSKDVIESLTELKKIFEKINKNKEELKMKIYQIFTEIRTLLNKREDELLSGIDKLFDEIYFKEELINECEKLPNKIKINIEKAKEINTNKNIKNTLNYKINDCINLENFIKYINNISINIEKSIESINTKIIFNNNKEKELKEIINLFGKIELQKDYLYKDFNIQNKEPFHKLNIHNGYVHCLTVLNDGRLVSSSYDGSIIIYNKKTFKDDLIIKEHNVHVFCVIQLSSSELVTCSKDIIIIKIKDRHYEVLQRINLITNKDYYLLKVIELKNKNIVSCSNDSSIIFYEKNNNLEYQINNKINSKGGCYTVVQTKENEICYSEGSTNNICFYDFIEKNNKSSFKIDYICRGSSEFIMISKNLLLIPGQNKISIINVNDYKLINIIDVPGANWILGVCILTENVILTGDYSKTLRQWKIEGNNLILISKKENAHNNNINCICKLGNGRIASSSDDNHYSVHIW